MKTTKLNPKRKRKANRRFAAARGSAAHVHFEITTKEGNRAMIKGDRYMPETTMRAIASMIDALSQAIVRGEIVPPNDGAMPRAVNNQKI